MPRRREPCRPRRAVSARGPAVSGDGDLGALPSQMPDPRERATDELAAHCRIVLRRLRDGNVIPFLGAGTNLCGRP